MNYNPPFSLGISQIVDHEVVPKDEVLSHSELPIQTQEVSRIKDFSQVEEVQLHIHSFSLK